MKTIECKLCEYSATSDTGYKVLNTLKRHIKTTHTITYKEYGKLYMDDNLSEITNEYREHGRELSKTKLRDPVYINKQNKNKLSELGEVEYNSLCECSICGLKAKQLYKHVSNIHDMSSTEYRETYPNSRMESDEYLSYLSESRSGENNPMWGNGDPSMSPFSPKF